MSYTLAVFLVLLAASMWGSWSQCVKHLDDYPLDAFVLNVFILSVVLVWGVLLAVDGVDGVRVIGECAQHNPLAVWGTLLCGAIYVQGVRLSLTVVHNVGLVLTTAVSSSSSIILGTLLSVGVGGLAPGTSLPLLLFGGVILVAALTSCVRAGHLRESERGGGARQASPAGESMSLLKAVGLAFLSSVLTVSYALGMSIGLRSPFHPEALPSLQFMGMLSVGALLGVVMTSGVRLWKHGQVRAWLRTPPKYLGLAGLSAICHFGGNIINSLASPVISVGLAWPMGMSASMWTYVWGLAYGEFKGASKRVYGFLFGGIALFIAGVIVLTAALYWH